ncbi:MAG: hypothetical protein ACFB15_20050 [Cyclobacteriaceae bacterium]
MEDYFQILVFLAFVVFSILSRILNPKKKKPPVRGPKEQPRYEDLDDVSDEDKPVVAQEEPERRPVSFEDILREMMGDTSQRQPEPPPPPVERQKPKPKKTEPATSSSRSAQKKATRIADKISLEDSGKRIKAIELEEKKNTVAQEVAEALKTPKYAREAIILSEIINRKYF